MIMHQFFEVRVSRCVSHFYRIYRASEANKLERYYKIYFNNVPSIPIFIMTLKYIMQKHIIHGYAATCLKN